MLLRVVDDDVFRDIEIGEGELFLLPGVSAVLLFICLYSIHQQPTHLTIPLDLLIP